MKLTAVRFEKGARPSFVLWSGRMLEVPLRPHPEGRRIHVMTYPVSATERGARNKARKMWTQWDRKARWASDRIAAESAYRACLQRTIEAFDDAVKAMNERDGKEA